MAKPEIGSHLMDVVSDTITYEGFAVRKGASTASAIWKIKKITFDADENFTSEKFADSNELYDNIWDNHTTLTYT